MIGVLTPAGMPMVARKVKRPFNDRLVRVHFSPTRNSEKKGPDTFLDLTISAPIVRIRDNVTSHLSLDESALISKSLIKVARANGSPVPERIPDGVLDSSEAELERLTAKRLER